MLCLRPVFVLGCVPLFGISRHFYPLKNVSVNVVLTFRPTSGGPHWLMAVSVLVNNRLPVLRCWVHMRRRNDEVFLSKQVVCRPSRTMTNPFTFLLRCSFPPTCWKCALHTSVHFTEHIFWFICLKGDRLIGGTVQPERVFYYRRRLVLFEDSSFLRRPSPSLFFSIRPRGEVLIYWWPNGCSCRWSHGKAQYWTEWQVKMSFETKCHRAEFILPQPCCCIDVSVSSLLCED